MNDNNDIMNGDNIENAINKLNTKKIDMNDVYDVLVDSWEIQYNKTTTINWWIIWINGWKIINNTIDLNKLETNLQNLIMDKDVYIGYYDPTMNIPTLINGIGIKGNYYITSVEGSHDFWNGLITFDTGDIVYYNGTLWIKREFTVNPTEIIFNGIMPN